MSVLTESRRGSQVPAEIVDRYCALVWVFELHEDRVEDFKALCEQVCGRVGEEPKCVSHRFSYNGKHLQYRVVAEDAFGVLAHVVDLGELLEDVLKTVTLVRLEIHAPGDQLEQLRGPLAAFEPDFYTADFCTADDCRAP